MKKYLLSIIIIFLFVIYSLQQQRQATSIVVTPPSSIAQPFSTPTSSNNPPDTSSTPPLPQSTIYPTSTPQANRGYKNGSYTGDAADAFYGNIQVQVNIIGGKISDVQFLQYPNDRETSISINSQAMPYLRQEAIQAQSANVDIVSGASDSSRAFQQSLQSALDKART